MTRPEIIRADSIDLQDQNAPSAKDHSRQPTQPSPLGNGPPAPHQAGALRVVAAEVAEESVRSPRVSKEWTNGEVQQSQGYDEDDDLAGRVSAKLNGQGQDNLAVAQNGGLAGNAGDDSDNADGEGDDSMDDDMMDKISSSPSIDDGGYSVSLVWPQRLESLSQSPVAQSLSQAWCERPPSTLGDHAVSPLRKLGESACDIVPLEYLQFEDHYHHHKGGYPETTQDYGLEERAAVEEYNEQSTHPDSTVPYTGTYIEDYDQYYDLDLEPQNGTVHNIENCETGPEDDPFFDHICANHEDLHSSIEDDPAMTIPYESSEDGDDDYEIPSSVNARFVDSGWGGECLQDLEDIDFEFVYALHTFVATVEGQANATKGDTMVLLDDSNSYWWLVRVVKDSSIGYLPAEHIETPTERLARFNKHRNIDLTSAMLGDQAEKSMNPIKKVIRRRNAKNVTFAAPTYVEASDVDYSTEEEDGDELFYGQNGQQAQAAESQEQKSTGDDDDNKTVEPLKSRSELREVTTDPSEPEASRADGSLNSSETARSSDDFFDGKMESKSRNGTLRNTDSFFKDDTVETRKITLTPNLLRDDSSTSTRTSNDSKELRQRPSLDRLEKDSVTEKGKDKKDRKEKKEKEKKPGMLSGLFKRKEKKSKAIDDEIEEVIASKHSGEATRSSPAPSKDSDDIASLEESQTRGITPEVQRQPSKLQKQPRIENSPGKKTPTKDSKLTENQQTPAPERAPPVETAQAPSLRLVKPDTTRELQQTRSTTPEATRPSTATQTPTKEQKSTSTISKILRSASSGGSEPKDPKPVKLTKAKERVELDDFDSTPEDSPVEEPQHNSIQQQSQPLSQRPIPGSFPESYVSTPAAERSDPVNEKMDRLSESPVHVSPVAPLQTYPPPLMVDNSSQEEPASPVSSASPELIDPEDGMEKKGGSSVASTTWSDSHLRTFFDDDGDIKDLLVVVYDKSGVVPAGPDHPITGNMFKDENAKLADITQRLDGMLGDWLARKMRTQSSSR